MTASPEAAVAVGGASTKEPAPGTGTTGRLTLVDLFFKQVRERSAQPALYFRAAGRYRAITWGDFDVASRRLAAYIVTQGVKPQEHVAIWSNNRPEWHIADIATLQLRCRPVPVYLTLSAEQGGYVLGHSESRIAVVENKAILERVLEVRDQLPRLQRVIVIEGLDKASDDGFVITWEEALHAGEKALEDEAVAQEIGERVRAVDFDDIATLIYTSGTTGPPKAVTLTHRNCGAIMDAISTFIEVGPDERVLSYLPLAHVAERIVSEFRSYAYGNPTYFLDGLPHLGERLREIRPTQFFGVPRIWEKMALRVRNGVEESSPIKRTLAHWALRVGEQEYKARAAGRVPSAWLRSRHRLADKLVLRKMRATLGFDQAKVLAVGAAPIGADVLIFFNSIGLEICEVYGQTEGTALTTMNRPGLSRPGTVGTRLPGIDVKIADDGEILVHGPNVFSGYYKDDAATAETLIDGWLHTGDIGEFDADGYLRITDRKKDLIITAGGKNIAPSNIEGLLKQHPLIANAVAIGDKRPFVSALLTLDPEEVVSFAKQRGLPDDVVELAHNDTVRAEIATHVNRINEHLSHVEQVKKWALLDRDFAMGDELTPTLKVKRKVVAEKYADTINGLYS